jgi:ferredoxin
VAVSLLFLLLASLPFLDGWRLIPTGVAALPGSVQLVPALLRTLSGWGFWVGCVLLVVVATLVWGRVYCSSVCPLGTLQDVLIRLSLRLRRKRPRFSYRAPPFRYHYSLLFLSLVAFAAGTMTLIDLLEPFSVYGRIVQGIFRPALVGAWNEAVHLMVSAADVRILPLSPPVVTTAGVGSAVLMLSLLLWLTWRHGRLFCNLLCPAGALLGLLSRLSVMKISIDTQGCNECGLCEKVCKAGCIDSTKKKIEFSACVGCYNCLEACPTVGVAYAGASGQRSAPDRRRRTILTGMLGSVLASASRGAGGLVERETTAVDTVAAVPEPAVRAPVTPPGAVGTALFVSRCTACHLCLSACPSGVLVPSFFEYGVSGVLQPRLDYRSAYCIYDCVRCTEVCPSGALAPVSPEEKKLLQIGVARFYRDDCIVITKEKDCGACTEHCPTKAVTMIPFRSLMVPKTTDALCIGCGACERACPTVPRKAIYVEARTVHGRAERPTTTPIQSGPAQLEEFPF